MLLCYYTNATTRGHCKLTLTKGKKFLKDMFVDWAYQNYSKPWLKQPLWTATTWPGTFFVHRQSSLCRKCTANSDNLSTKDHVYHQGWSFWTVFTVTSQQLVLMFVYRSYYCLIAFSFLCPQLSFTQFESDAFLILSELHFTEGCCQST